MTFLSGDWNQDSCVIGIVEGFTVTSPLQKEMDVTIKAVLYKIIKSKRL